MAALRMPSSFLLSLLIASAAVAAAAPAHHLPAPVPAPAHHPPAPEPAPAHQPPAPEPAPAHQPPAPEPAPAHPPPPPVIHINGTVPCGVGPMMPGKPVFPYASVMLQCGRQEIWSTTSDANGVFAMDVSSDSTKLLSVLKPLKPLKPLEPLELPELLKQCILMIRTPPSACNPALPTMGHLQAFLNPLSDGTTGFPFNCIPGKFFVGP